MNYSQRWKAFCSDPTAVIFFVLSIFFTGAFIRAETAGHAAGNALHWKITGGILFLTGWIIMLNAKKQLGRNWSPDIRISSETNRDIITGGLYAYMRHPIYTGYIFVMAGMDIYSFDPLTACISLFAAAFIVIRITMEEKILVKKFGSEYLKYAARVKKLFPYIY